MPLFFLVPNARLEKIMDWRGAAERETAGFSDRVAASMERSIAQNLARKGIRA